jgi:hypothetical protein
MTRMGAEWFLHLRGPCILGVEYSWGHIIRTVCRNICQGNAAPNRIIWPAGIIGVGFEYECECFHCKSLGTSDFYHLVSAHFTSSPYCLDLVCNYSITIIIVSFWDNRISRIKQPKRWEGICLCLIINHKLLLVF